MAEQKKKQGAAGGKSSAFSGMIKFFLCVLDTGRCNHALSTRGGDNTFPEIKIKLLFHRPDRIMMSLILD